MKHNFNISNSQGKIYYGMHFYPGVAEYAELDNQRVFLNEDTLRKMDATFQGKPIFVEHVDEVEQDIDELRKEADGWVVESFFNTADGKHWAKFIIVSERGERAIERGMRLSNSYLPTSFGPGGQWNGVSYTQQVINGVFEHLAIVSNPRYEESVIMTPEEFKAYNDDLQQELKRISNSKKGDTKMGLSLFKRTKVENSSDMAGMSVLLPKSGKEVTIEKLVADADEFYAKKKNSLADPSDKVKMHDGNMCNVGELVKKHKALHDELEGMKTKNAEESESEMGEDKEGVDVEGDDKAVDNDDPSEADDEGAIEADKKDNEDDEDEDGESMDNEEEEDSKEMVDAAKKKSNAKKLANAVALKKKAAAKEKAEVLRNGHLNFDNEAEVVVETSFDRVERGKARYGSSN